MSKQPLVRVTIGTVTTKDVQLFHRTKALQLEGETMESIFRRGLIEIEQDHVKDLTQGNVA